MKKILILVCLVLLSLPVAAKSYYRGDINKDDKLDKEDIRLLVEVLTGKQKMPQDISLYDVNGDRQITLADLTALIETIKGNLPKELANDEIPTGGPGSFD